MINSTFCFTENKNICVAVSLVSFFLFYWSKLLEYLEVLTANHIQIYVRYM